MSAVGEEKRKLQDVVETVNAMLASDQLWTRFELVASEYPEIWVGSEHDQDGLPRGFASSSGAAAVLRNSDARFHVFRSVLGLTGTYYSKGADFVGECTNREGNTRRCRATAVSQNYSNLLVVTHGLGLRLEDGHEVVSIEVGREVFDRYNSPSTVEKSCTFNTIAHEWTHTIGKNQDEHWTVVEDTGNGIPEHAVKLSHLFGSVVQCSWLQDRKKIGARAEDLKSCVEKFGVTGFNSNECARGE